MLESHGDHPLAEAAGALRILYREQVSGISPILPHNTHVLPFLLVMHVFVCVGGGGGGIRLLYAYPLYMHMYMYV